MSVDKGPLAPRAALRWRRFRGSVFAVAAAGSLVLGALVVIVLIFVTLKEGLGLRAMHATADAGLALSLRAMTSGDGGETAAYVTIAQVEEGSRAAALGLVQGDALVSVAGQPVTSVKEVWQVVADEALPTGGAPVTWVPNMETLIGELVAVPLPGETVGFRARVDWLAPGSEAERAGVREGDVILAAGTLPVSGTLQAWQAVAVAARRSGGAVELQLERDGQPASAVLQAGRSGQLVLEGSLAGALWEFVTQLDEPRYPEQAGLASAILGSLYVMLVTAAIAFPLGAAAAIYLEEYAPRNAVTGTIEVLISNLAGIPSVVYGILGLELLVQSTGLGMGRSIKAGGFTLALLILPVMIVASREALRTVPPWIRQAAFAVGATPWQVVRHQVLPYAMPGMLTAMILSISRAIGEAAPLIMLGAFLYVTYLPQGLDDTFTVVPLQIFSWATRPQAGYDTIAAAAILVLMAILLVLNGAAIVLRNRFQRRW